jgi:hypothetical protein
VAFFQEGRVIKRFIGALVCITVLTAPAFGIPETRLVKNLPVRFIENQGQWSEEVAYHVGGSNMTLFFTSCGVTFGLNENRYAVKLDFEGADQAPRGDGRCRTVVSYFKGDPED